MNSKLKSPKNVDLSQNPERLNLLKQRLFGNDIGSDSNNLAQGRDSSSSVGLGENTSGDLISTPVRSNSVTVYTDNSRKMIEEAQYKEELKKQLREENDQKLEKMKQFAINCLFKCNIEKQKIRTIEISEKSERLGNIFTSLSLDTKWVGGIEFDELEHELNILNQKNESLKKADQQKNSDALNQRKSAIQALIKEKKSLSRKLDEERINFFPTLRMFNEQNQSEYKVNQELNGGRYILTDFCGRGGCSEVWKAFDKIEIRYVAIKIQNMKNNWTVDVKKNFIKHSAREIKIMEETQNPHVIEFIEYFYVGENTLAIVMEYCGGGDLSMMLKKRGKIPEIEAKFILGQIINGLLALRSKDNYVIHYDLKPGNILFSDTGVVKIIDFGLSKIIEKDTSSIELTSQGTGTYYYAPPETFRKDQVVFITKSVDTWSLGMIFYEMIYGCRPFGEGQSQNTYATHFNEIFKKVVFPQSTKLSQEGKNFIEMCLIRDPVKRPELHVLAEESYIKQEIEKNES